MKRVLLWVPLPPPFAGPEVASQALVDACRAYLPDARVENATLRSSNLRKGRFDLEGIVAFGRAYRRFLTAAKDSDVVYLIAAANTVGCLRDAVLIATARALRKQVVLHLRGGRYGDYYAAHGRVMKRILSWSWGSARRAIVQTPRLRTALAGAASHVEVVVVPNGLAAQGFPAKRSYTTARPRILFVGHLVYSKGFYDLILAFRRLRLEHPGITLVCAGELPTPERSFADFLPDDRRDDYLRRRHELCAQIREFIAAGAVEGVEYHGVVSGEAKRELFASADVFVLPSYTEGFSLAILEAMFHGLPVVTTSAGGSPDIIADRNNGFVVPPGDVDALVGALHRLVADATLRETIGRTNASQARERYDLDHVAREFARAVVPND